MNWIIKVLGPSLGLTSAIMAMVYALGVASDPSWDGKFDIGTWCINAGILILGVVAGTINYRRTKGKEGLTPFKNLWCEFTGRDC